MYATADMLLTSQNRTERDSAGSSVESVLVSAVLEGDRDGFSRLYDLYAPLVHGILLARVPRAEVDDLVQDIFLHAFKKLHTLRDASDRGFACFLVEDACGADSQEMHDASCVVVQRLYGAITSTQDAIVQMEAKLGLASRAT